MGPGLVQGPQGIQGVLAIALDVVKEPMFLLLVACGIIYLMLGDIEEAFGRSDLVIEGEYRTGHQEQLYLENNAMMAERVATALYASVLSARNVTF